MIKKILKNNTENTIQILSKDVLSQESYEINPCKWDKLSESIDIESLIQSGNIIVNNGCEDLSSVLGIEHVKTGITKVCEPVVIIPGIGDNNPELILLNHASYGYKAQIGDTGYFQVHADNLIGTDIQVSISYCINNDQSDKWVVFEIYLLSTNGEMDKIVTNYDVNAVYGPFEVHNIPYQIKTRTVDMPPQLFNNNEKTLFFGLKRLDATDYNKTNPTNDPIVLKICVSYYKKVMA